VSAATAAASASTSKAQQDFISAAVAEVVQWDKMMPLTSIVLLLNV